MQRRDALSALLQKLNQRIEERSILKHPFYQAWEQGKLTIEDLQRYAPQYRYVETEIARTFQALGRHFPDERQFAEIYRQECEHVLYWMHFCERLGLERLKVRGTPALASTRALVGLLSEMYKLPSSALVSAYVIESQNPGVAQTKHQGMIKHFGFDPDAPADAEALAFFREHMEKDPHHAALLGEWIETSGVDENEELATADQVLEKVWEFLDGVSQTKNRAPRTLWTG